MTIELIATGTESALVAEIVKNELLKRDYREEGGDMSIDTIRLRYQGTMRPSLETLLEVTAKRLREESLHATAGELEAVLASRRLGDRDGCFKFFRRSNKTTGVGRLSGRKAVLLFKGGSNEGTTWERTSVAKELDIEWIDE